MALRWIIGAAVLFVLAAGSLAVWLLQDNLVRGLINPRIPYETYLPPPAPDYSKPGNWLVWPEVSSDSESEQPAPAIFYLHSTSYRSSEHWNAPVREGQTQAVNERVLLPNQAGPFSTIGEVYAPKYRQATLYAFFTQKHQGREARKTAYLDVRQAFRAFLAAVPEDNAIILAGYGQGGLHVQRLLIDYFQNDEPLRRRLVAAYIVDQPTPLDLFNYAMAETPPCKYPTDVRCVVSWNAYENGFDSEIWRTRNRVLVWDDRGGLQPVAKRPLLCTNPLDWKLSSELVAPESHLGAASSTGIRYGEAPVMIEQAVSVQCDEGIAITSRPQQRWLRRPSGFGRQWAPLNYNLFYEDIRLNAAQRVAELAVIRKEEDQSAPPMQEAVDLIESPINTVPD